MSGSGSGGGGTAQVLMKCSFCDYSSYPLTLSVDCWLELDEGPEKCETFCFAFQGETLSEFVNSGLSILLLGLFNVKSRLSIYLQIKSTPEPQPALGRSQSTQFLEVAVVDTWHFQN